jgi:hypothetical protein
MSPINVHPLGSLTVVPVSKNLKVLFLAVLALMVSTNLSHILAGGTLSKSLFLALSNGSMFLLSANQKNS